jgi:hypothetical protein
VSSDASIEFVDLVGEWAISVVCTCDPLTSALAAVSNRDPVTGRNPTAAPDHARVAMIGTSPAHTSISASMDASSSGGPLRVSPTLRRSRARSLWPSAPCDGCSHLRRAVGCLDVAICADLVDPGRVNIFERWESQAALETFRSSGPDTEQRPGMLTVSVQEYDIADVRPVFGNEAE